MATAWQCREAPAWKKPHGVSEQSQDSAQYSANALTVRCSVYNEGKIELIPLAAGFVL